MKSKYSKQAQKFLDSQGETVCARIMNAVSKLPYGDVVKLKGYKNKYRLRVGDYRIIFERVLDVIQIEIIDNRGQAYKA